jgi:YVTN family beta-propeller protein
MNHLSTKLLCLTLTLGSAWAVNAATYRAYIVNNKAPSKLTVVDDVTGDILAQPATGNTSVRAVISPDRKTVFVSNQDSGTVSVIDTASNTVKATVN